MPTTHVSTPWPSVRGCRPSILSAIISAPAVSCPTEQTTRTCSDAPETMSIRFCAGQSQPTSRSSSRPNSISSLIYHCQGAWPQRAADAAQPPRRGDRVNRRKVIMLLGGAAAAWPLAARAQERVRRIGMILPATSDDPEFQIWVEAFLQGLAQLGWTIGHNVRIDTRWATANGTEIRRHATELVALAPDVILAHGGSTVGPLLQVTRTVPIVFPVAGDPVGAGFVDSLARAGGNATGFMTFEYSMGGKWLELLKPGVTRVAVLRDATTPNGIGQFGAIQAVAPSLRVEINP